MFRNILRLLIYRVFEFVFFSVRWYINVAVFSTCFCRLYILRVYARSLEKMRNKMYFLRFFNAQAFHSFLKRVDFWGGQFTATRGSQSGREKLFLL